MCKCLKSSTAEAKLTTANHPVRRGTPQPTMSNKGNNTTREHHNQKCPKRGTRQPTMSTLGVPLDVVVHVLYGEVDVGYLYPKNQNYNVAFRAHFQVAVMILGWHVSHLFLTLSSVMFSRTLFFSKEAAIVTSFSLCSNRW